MAARKRKPAIDLGEERAKQRSNEQAIEKGKYYNNLKGYYVFANNDLSGETPTRGRIKHRGVGLGWGATRKGRGRIAQRAITQRKNQQRKNVKRGAK
jgi:hypothetical protein